MSAITPITVYAQRTTPGTFAANFDAFMLQFCNSTISEMNTAFGSMTLVSLSTTSATSNDIGTGDKTFTVEAGKSFLPGHALKIAQTSNVANWMHGEVVSYSGTTLVVKIRDTAGSGTITDWTITFAGVYVETDWKAVNAVNYTATPASTSTITMLSDLTGVIKQGMSLQYTYNGTTYYGMVGAITSNLLTVWGAPLDVLYDLTSLKYGGGTMRQVWVTVPSYYEDASDATLIANDLDSQFVWTMPTSYLVYFSVYSRVHDTGTHGQASVRINSQECNTTAGGETIAANTTWYPTVVNIDTTYYDVNFGEVVEVTSVKNGNGDALDLTVMMVFLTP
jgi:hypothetical protein